MEYYQDNFLADFELEAAQGDFYERERCNLFQGSSEASFSLNLQVEPLCIPLGDLQDISLVEPSLAASEEASTAISECSSDEHSDLLKNAPTYQFVANPSSNCKIGGISYEERQKKLQKYREKKARRNWRKKISYDCRKRVADKRIRVKGRFVTKEQAMSLLEIQSLLNLEVEKQEFTDKQAGINN
ncbi:unnamed protein product [Blepharisma stoltei]|uniref:CCT domain-containing protein n=1 Tax=Blepharisma stoltei TaxID=1481888 RepID=A0AAU9JYR9_9CILI|nr:unnamed protein product [Blepharisma stoltei]